MQCQEIGLIIQRQKGEVEGKQPSVCAADDGLSTFQFHLGHVLHGVRSMANEAAQHGFCVWS